MIDHVILNVKDLTESRRFYERAFAPLGYGVVWNLPKWVGFGPPGKAGFWIALREPRHTGVHVALRCEDGATVDRFYAAAMEAGGRDNGTPGIREHYGTNYYSAFVFDPDGNNIEAVCRKGGV
jgi:catechol 2,3-dioxygenase-like lactoylglutathione lyase family enzyme